MIAPAGDFQQSLRNKASMRDGGTRFSGVEYFLHNISWYSSLNIVSKHIHARARAQTHAKARGPHALQSMCDCLGGSNPL